MTTVEPIYRTIGARIRDARRRRDLTQAELGARVVPSMSRASVANIEAAKQRLLAHTLVQIARILGVGVGSLTEAHDVVPEQPAFVPAPDEPNWAGR
jgi:transcriptional regulator with XRE-family HTH domain